MKPSDRTRQRLFKEAERYFSLISRVVTRALEHRYRFVSDEWFQGKFLAGELSCAETNHFVALDLLEKSHLAAVTALIRIERWADAACIMCEAENFPGFAGALRGLIENGGDAVDGLMNVSGSLAANHRTLRGALEGRINNDFIRCVEIERVLDHYIHAGWTGKNRDPVYSAKANIDYVRLIEQALPGAVSLYHRLCAIVHPSNASIDWLFDMRIGEGGMALSADDSAKIAALCDEFPDVGNITIQMSCNAALMTLRVLHKFRLHPKIPELRTLTWPESGMAREIESLLRS